MTSFRLSLCLSVSLPLCLSPTLARFTGYEAFSEPPPPPRVLPLTAFGNPKPSFEWCMTDAVSDLLHARYWLSILQWNAGAARRQPTRLVTAMCGAFDAVLLQEARDYVQHISDQFKVYTDDDDLAMLLNRDTFLPDAVKNPTMEESTSTTTWWLKALVVCGHLRRPPVGSPKTITLCTVHLHNVVAKKRDAATSLPQRFYAHMKLLEVDFVGGDFDRAAKGTIADVFSDPEFVAPGSVPLWGAGGREGDDTDCRGFLYMLRRPLINKHGVHTFANGQLGLNESDESTHTIQSSCTFRQPTSRVAPERHYEVTQHKRGCS